MLLVLALSTTGCAAVFRGSKQEVKLEAAPEKADVRVEGKFQGSTPVTLNLDRQHDQNLSIVKDGYREQQVYLRKRADTGWFVWDIATCVVPVMLCIPLLVDGISGAWYSFDDDFRVKLEPATPVAPAVAPVAPAPPPSASEPAPAAKSPAGY